MTTTLKKLVANTALCLKSVAAHRVVEGLDVPIRTLGAIAQAIAGSFGGAAQRPIAEHLATEVQRASRGGKAAAMLQLLGTISMMTAKPIFAHLGVIAQSLQLALGERWPRRILGGASGLRNKIAKKLAKAKPRKVGELEGAGAGGQVHSKGKAASTLLGAPRSGAGKAAEIFFAYTKADLSTSDKSTLKTLIKEIGARKASFQLIGRADLSGGSKENKRLAQRRAEAVKRAIEASARKLDSISIKSVGETGYKLYNPYARRVDVFVQVEAAPTPAPVPRKPPTRYPVPGGHPEKGAGFTPEDPKAKCFRIVGGKKVRKTIHEGFFRMSREKIAFQWAAGRPVAYDVVATVDGERLRLPIAVWEKRGTYDMRELWMKEGNPRFAPDHVIVPIYFRDLRPGLRSPKTTRDKVHRAMLSLMTPVGKDELLPAEWRKILVLGSYLPKHKVYPLMAEGNPSMGHGGGPIGSKARTIGDSLAKGLDNKDTWVCGP